MKLFNWIVRKVDEHKYKAATEKFGGSQTCPWCKQCANQGNKWSFTTFELDPFFDKLTCGICGGTSIWMFTLLMTYVGPWRHPLMDIFDVSETDSDAWVRIRNRYIHDSHDRVNTLKSH